ncbi:diaminopimelate dehydrogenase [Desulfovibrio sp. OttesenSCG-928-O18]|nr:diaminopimelate dehydrogenase [Desulfovibrio sp. OttesenSCG-928-O18]
MASIKVAVHGLGNIGRHVVDCLSVATDMECIGVVRRAASLGKNLPDLKGVPDFASVENLAARQGKPDVVILCGPSRSVPEDAESYLSKGYRTVDSFDIHDEISALIPKLDAVARKHNTASISAAGWDPGSDSMLRALFEAMTPVGVTFTNFGRGRSMGHSVAARAIKNVADATAITIPIGGGRHSRLVYILPEKGASFEAIKKDLAADPYFSHDPLDIREVKSPEEMALVADNSHGVLMERVGASGTISNQRLAFDMRIDNPALTAQVLVSSARAITRMGVGAHTLIDVPVVAMLPGTREANIARLV